MLTGYIRQTICRTWSGCVVVRRHSLCITLWNTSLWWWTCTHPLQEDQVRHIPYTRILEQECCQLAVHNTPSWPNEEGYYRGCEKTWMVPKGVAGISVPITRGAGSCIHFLFYPGEGLFNFIKCSLCVSKASLCLLLPYLVLTVLLCKKHSKLTNYIYEYSQITKPIVTYSADQHANMLVLAAPSSCTC